MNYCELFYTEIAGVNYTLVWTDLYIEDAASKKRLNEDLASVVVEAGVVFAQNFRSSLCQRDRYICIVRARQIVLEWATKGGCWLSRIERSRPPSREDTKKRTRKLLSLPFTLLFLSLSLSLSFSLSLPISALFLLIIIRRRRPREVRSLVRPFLKGEKKSRLDRGSYAHFR